ncbi:UPF0762 protein, partial [Pristimantis euphronides]
MNYYLAVIPFLGALDAGLFEGFPYGIVISPPDEFQSDFCYSIVGCLSIFPKVMDEWKTFFKFIKTRNKISDNFTKDQTLSYMWRAHVESISVALPRCSKRLRYLSGPEGSFGKDWATSVDFLAATNFPTDFQSINDFQIFLPPRTLLKNDRAPFISDFSEQQNRLLFMLHYINQFNGITGGYLLRIWKKAMCSEQGKVAGRDLLEDMVTNLKLAPETIVKIMIELTENFHCKV